MKKSTIKITCSGADEIPFTDLREIQGSLKSRTAADIDHIDWNATCPKILHEKHRKLRS